MFHISLLFENNNNTSSNNKLCNIVKLSSLINNNIINKILYIILLKNMYVNIENPEEEMNVIIKNKINADFSKFLILCTFDLPFDIIKFVFMKINQQIKIHTSKLYTLLNTDKSYLFIHNITVSDHKKTMAKTTDYDIINYRIITEDFVMKIEKEATNKMIPIITYLIDFGVKQIFFKSCHVVTLGIDEKIRVANILTNKVSVIEECIKYMGILYDNNDSGY